MKSVSLSLSSCLLKSRLGEYKCSFVLEIAVSLPMLNSGFFFLLAPPLFITTSVRGGGEVVKYIGLGCLSLPALMT